MEIRFVHTWALFLLWLAPILLAGAIALLRKKEARIAGFVAPLMQKRLRPSSDKRRQILQITLVSTGMLLLLIALARPQWGRSEQTVFRKGRDIVICLDVSRSMLANDVHPYRLQRAKIDIMDLLNELSGDRTALIAFRSRAITLCPLTTDYAFVRHILDMAGIHSAPRGETNIGSAIDLAVELLAEEDNSHKAILLISDGEDLTGRALQAAEKAAKRNIPIFTVGLGRAAGSTIPDPDAGGKLQHKGTDVVTKLDNDSLYNIARKTGGAYIPIQTAGTAGTTLGDIYKDHFSNIAARDHEETISFSYTERFHYFLLPGALLILAACFLSRGRLAGTRKSALKAGLKNIQGDPPGLKHIAVLLVLIAPTLAIGADTGTSAPKELPQGRDAARKAQSLFNAGKFEEAAELYRHAEKTMTGPAKEALLYNAAAALFRNGKHDEAIDLLNAVSGEGTIPLDLLNMALGTAHYRSLENAAATNEAARLEYIASNMEKALEYFAEAARINPDRRETAVNNAGILMEKLPEARQAAKHSALIAENEQVDAFQLLDKILTNQRDITTKAAAAYTTDDPSQITLLEDLAARQEKNADLWIPMKEKISAAANASTNQLPLDQLEKFTQDMSTTMREASTGMKDLDTGGYYQSAAAGEATYQLWKNIAPYSNVLEENLLRQSNAMDNAAAKVQRLREQKEGADLTSIFQQRFEEAFPEDAPAPQDGEEGMTPETRARIMELANTAFEAQQKAVSAIESGTNSEQQQKTAVEALTEISSLLPRKQDQSQQDQQEQDQQQDKQDQQKEDDQPQEKQDQQEDPQNQDAESTGQEAEPKDEQEQKKEDQELSESEVERILERALQREKEREAEKRRRAETSQPQMIDRDW